MERRSLGQSGRTVSAIGLGCMGMSDFYGPHDDAESLETLAAALDHGIDFLDTSDMYGIGDNEELLGRFLKGKRDRITLATKFGIVRERGRKERRIDNSPAYVRQACDGSLKRLGIDTIDLYYLHRFDPAVPIEETVAAMAELVKAGKVRFLGLSEVSPQTLRRASAIHPIAALQSEYSLWTRDPEAGMLATCRELGTTFVAYSPLGRAFLTGALTSPDVLASDDMRRGHPRFQAEAMARNNRLVEALGEFAGARGATPAKVALAWLLSKHDHVVPIPGTRRTRHLAENVAATKLRLSAADITALDTLFAPGVVAGERKSAERMKLVESAS
jgi:aryl-alcohol dehydrogenase-like predicted oxidoreductase